VAKTNYLSSRWQSLLYRQVASKLFPWLAYDPRTNLFIMEGGYVGAVYKASPLSGINDGVVQELHGMLMQDLPSGTVIQMIQLNVPDVSNEISAYEQVRSKLILDTGLTTAQRDILARAAQETALFMARKQVEGCFIEPKVPFTSTNVYWTFKFKTPEIPMDEHLEEISDRLAAIEGASSSFWLRKMDDRELVAVIRRMIHIDEPWDRRIAPDVLLRDQIMYAGDALTYEEGGIEIKTGKSVQHAVVISTKFPPESMNISVMNGIIGDPMGISTQFTKPNALIWTAHIPDQSSKAANVRAKSSGINYQAYGPLQKWVPALAKRKEGIDALISRMDDGDKIVECGLTVILWAESEKDATKSASLMEGYFSTEGFTMRRDTYIGAAQFFNSLPLFPSKESMALTRRYQTMSALQAVQMAPVLSDWPGQIGGPHINSISQYGAGTLLISRRGHPVWADPFATSGNYNFTIAGDSRSGKTFFANQVLFDHIQSGGQGWVIEIGRGFEKLCKVIGGDHIRLSESSDVGLNPFTTVQSIDDEIDELTGIFSAMIDPSPVLTQRTGLSEGDKSMVREAIRSVYGSRGQMAKPTHVAEYLFSQPNERSQEMARMMADYREDGAYGHWFNEPMNVDLSGRFVVLELSDLQSRKGLQTVVLLQMMFAINREIQDGSLRDNRRRMLFVDEASELLKIPAAADFMEGLYRRAGKSRGSVGVGIQRVNDLYRSDQAAIVASQSQTMYLLRQKDETVTDLENTKRISLDPWGFALLRSLRKTNDFSEVMVLESGSYVVARLTVDPYRRVLFSSTGEERDAILSAIDRGENAADVIQAFASRG
jgi:conjugal transfer ATP-binding protein TraC